MALRGRRLARGCGRRPPDAAGRKRRPLADMTAMVSWKYFDEPHRSRIPRSSRVSRTCRRCAAAARNIASARRDPCMCRCMAASIRGTMRRAASSTPRPAAMCGSSTAAPIAPEGRPMASSRRRTSLPGWRSARPSSDRKPAGIRAGEALAAAPALPLGCKTRGWRGSRPQGKFGARWRKLPCPVSPRALAPPLAVNDVSFVVPEGDSWPFSALGLRQVDNAAR